jgi:peroxiredoxin
MYGKKTMGVIRSSFLIGPDGTIIAKEQPASPIGNAQRMLEALKKAKAS